jgi:EAL domain-containing protein (putative c-di-GMP-specific phosphodiesterase class I)
VARLGGDEFTVLMTNLDDAESVQRVAEDIVRQLSASIDLEGDVVYVSASIGIAMYPGDASGLDELLKCADQAMYVAKDAGRNRHAFYSPDLQETAQKRARLLNDLRSALIHNEFCLYYQPIVNLGSGRIEKVEALIRWQHPSLGLINPMEFIPLAEESGLIVEIGDWVFHEAARQAEHWHHLRNETLVISINVSPAQFRSSNSVFNAWIDHLRDINLPGIFINVEITEGLILDASPTVTNGLLKFRDAGILVSLDDFGTGYSALSYLRKFNINFLKIDQSFVRNLSCSSSDMTLCEAIIVMAHKLGIKVIAEGVETTQQRDLLQAAGCDFAQGFLISHPVPAQELEKILLS